MSLHSMSLHSKMTSLRDSKALRQRFRDVRAYSVRLVAPLSPEDCQIQSMPDASPTKWHFAHTTWFFETFILVNYLKGYKRFNEDFNYLYNSYYNGIGAQFPRLKRGLVTRPSFTEIEDYRAFVDEHMEKLIDDEGHKHAKLIAFLSELGTHHEQQHQELILSDIKHAFSNNSIAPPYCPFAPSMVKKASDMRWEAFEEGNYVIGYQGDGFAYDNEKPVHKRWLNSFKLASRPVINREYIDFIEDGGYDRPELWLSEGWAFVQEHQRRHPLYWQEEEGKWTQFTLSGRQSMNMEEPLCHINYYEANAYAMWAGARLPSEAEWEVAAQSLEETIEVPTPATPGPTTGPTPATPGPTPATPGPTPATPGPTTGATTGPTTGPTTGRFHPSVAANGNGLRQMIGEVWEWTSSSYDAYPGFMPLDGAAGEYNGKFMCNQYVLRGGSAITSPEHIRSSYRNFFPTASDWQFSGLRLAQDIS